MKNHAFTLIELLVVVLIIGILAAIALPQYEKAVLKSRYVQLMLVGDSIGRAEKIYYLANGTYTADYDSLGVDVDTNSDKYDCTLSAEYAEVVCQFRNLRGNRFGYHVYFGGRNQRYCYVRKGDTTSVYAHICKSLTGQNGVDKINGTARRGYLF